ncbi:CRISPR-associated helicase/endonuclease Cas3 [Dactylosporangium maewongense]|uniref:CRISPR-associated helicase/endonuclease Cas3 n=1 Tax=Dactylosporangium maewongense TaxID=634393 RepID=A0ABP4P9F9_9ACTN
MIHDGGKAWCEWQAKLLRVEASGARVGLDHKSFGVQLARRHGLEPVEWAVAGHHGGLTRRAEVDALFGEDDHREEQLRLGPWADSERVLRTLVPEIFSHVPALPGDFVDGGDRMVREFALRFLYSCLVDADVLDTQAHRLGLAGPRVGSGLEASMIFERFVARRSEFVRGRLSSPMDWLRESVFEQALAAAMVGPGLFRMTAPTGAAKTIAAAGFALRHAAEFGKRRVVVAVPFITITEQNAAVYRALLNDDAAGAEPVVLEHHSNVDVDRVRGDERTRSWQRFAAENWDAPFVVTTTVQLLESLFGRRPAQMRKVHRLADSVIVLDEVQALPHRLLPQVADALRILSERFGVTVLLSSATQPELWSLSPLAALKPRDVVEDVEAMFAGARRVRYQWRVDPKPMLADVVAEALGYRQVLVVVNTVRDARVVFEGARDLAAPDVRVVHLSTGMCAAHRQTVLERVRGWLAAGESLMLVSTSLIEAGVDVDFPVVYRAVAPPDSEAQAAGRCNREGRLGPEGGLVVLFDPADGGAPPSYQTQIDKAGAYFGPDKAEPDDLAALGRYFAALYRTLDIEGRGSVSTTIEWHRWHLDFVGVADGPPLPGGRGRDRTKAFRLILEDTVPVVVPYGSPDERRMVRDGLAALRGPTPDSAVWRRLQPFMTTVRRRTVDRPEIAALMSPVVGDLREWRGDYDDGFGLALEPRGEDFIL